MVELITTTKYYDRSPNKLMVVCIFNIRDLSQVTCEQRVMEGDARFDALQLIADAAHGKFAELIGLKAFYIDGPALLEDASDEALASPMPVVPNVKTDPEVSPLAFHITHQVPLSGHGAHAIHLPPARTAPRLHHLECFHDHVWIEHMLLESPPVQHQCVIRANLHCVGHDLAFEAADAWRFRIV